MWSWDPSHWSGHCWFNKDPAHRCPNITAYYSKNEFPQFHGRKMQWQAFALNAVYLLAYWTCKPSFDESWTCCHRALCMQEGEVDCHTSPLFGCCKETYFRDRRKLPCCSTMLELIHCDPCLRGCSATDVPQPCLPQLIAFYFWEFAPLRRLFVQKGGLP